VLHAAQLLAAAQSAWQPEWTVAVELVGCCMHKHTTYLWPHQQGSLTDGRAAALAAKCVHVQARAYGFQVVNASQEATQQVG
jgi:hypothetical protein